MAVQSNKKIRVQVKYILDARTWVDVIGATPSAEVFFRKSSFVSAENCGNNFFHFLILRGSLRSDVPHYIRISNDKRNFRPYYGNSAIIGWNFRDYNMEFPCQNQYS